MARTATPRGPSAGTTEVQSVRVDRADHVPLPLRLEESSALLVVVDAELDFLRLDLVAQSDRVELDQEVHRDAGGREKVVHQIDGGVAAETVAADDQVLHVREAVDEGESILQLVVVVYLAGKGSCRVTAEGGLQRRGEPVHTGVTLGRVETAEQHHDGAIREGHLRHAHDPCRDHQEDGPASARARGHRAAS